MFTNLQGLSLYRRFIYVHQPPRPVSVQEVYLLLFMCTNFHEACLCMGGLLCSPAFEACPCIGGLTSGGSGQLTELSGSHRRLSHLQGAACTASGRSYSPTTACSASGCSFSPTTSCRASGNSFGPNKACSF